MLTCSKAACWMAVILLFAAARPQPAVAARRDPKVTGAARKALDFLAREQRRQ